MTSRFERIHDPKRGWIRRREGFRADEDPLFGLRRCSRLGRLPERACQKQRQQANNDHAEHEQRPLGQLKAPCLGGEGSLEQPRAPDPDHLSLPSAPEVDHYRHHQCQERGQPEGGEELEHGGSRGVSAPYWPVA